MRRHGFTLMEVMVVISIIVLLIAMILPSFQHAKRNAERGQCLSNEGQMGRAMHAYEVDHKGFLPGPSWYGQQARYTKNTKTVSRFLASYMGFPGPESKAHDNRMFICPSYYRVRSPGFAPEVSVIYGALSELNPQGKRVFGYPEFDGKPEYPPDRLSVVKNPATAGAIRDIDMAATPTAGWVDQTARQPLHGYDGDEAVRNYLFFDTHAESVREPRF